MKITEQIHYLLQHLNKAEKKQFSLQADSKAPYYQLYKLLNVPELRTDEELAAQLSLTTADRAFIHAKTHLMKVLLDLVHQHESNDSQRIILQKQVFTAQILYAKDARIIAKSSLDKWIPKAIKYETFDILLLMLDLEQHILEQEYGSKPVLQAMAANRERFAEANAAFIELQAYRQLYREVNEYYRSEHIVSQDREMQQYFLNHELMKPPGTKWVTVQAYYHTVRAMLMLQCGQLTEAVKSADSLHGMLEGNAYKLLAEHPETISRAYHNITRVYYWAERHKDNLRVSDSTNRFLQSLQSFETLRIQNQQFMYNTYLISHTRLGHWEALAELAPEVEMLLEQYHSKLTTMLHYIIHFNLAVFYFFTGEYRQAQHKVSLILHQGERGVRRELYHYCLLFRLLILLETNEFDFLHYEYSNVQRYLKRREGMGPYEKAIMKAVKACMSDDGERPQDVYQTLIDELTPLQKDPVHKAGLMYLDVLTWAKRKLG